jgi:hypothetical protein
MLRFLAVCKHHHAKRDRAMSAADFGIFTTMSELDKKVVGNRLRAVMKELKIPTAAALADYLGVGEKTPERWLNGGALVPVASVRKIWMEHRIPLEWIYYGDGSVMPHSMYIRLEGLLSGAPVPPADPNEAEVPVIEASSEGPPRPRKTRKAATST